MTPSPLIVSVSTYEALGRRICELVRDLGRPVYIPPTPDEISAIQIIELENLLELDKNVINFAGEFQIDADDVNED